MLLRQPKFCMWSRATFLDNQSFACDPLKLLSYTTKFYMWSRATFLRLDNQCFPGLHSSKFCMWSRTTFLDNQSFACGPELLS